MVSNITLGQYVPGKSFLHRMDARVKIVLIIAFIVLVFVGWNYPRWDLGGFRSRGYGFF